MQRQNPSVHFDSLPSLSYFVCIGMYWNPNTNICMPIHFLCIGMFCCMYCCMYWFHVLKTYWHAFNPNRYVFNTYHLYWHASDGNNNLVLCMYSHSIQWHPQYMPIRRNVLACITIHNNTYQSVLACIAMLSCTYKIVVCANTDPIRTCIFNMCQYWSQYIHHHYPSTSQYRSIQTHTHTNTAPIQTNTHNVVFKICTSTC